MAMKEEVDLTTSGRIGTTNEVSVESSTDMPMGSSGGGGAPTFDKRSMETSGDNIQLEPTKDEMERERLVSILEQLQDDVARLSNMLMEKEAELAAVKRKLGITPYVEFKQSMSQGWKVVGDKWKEVQETETFKKLDSTLTDWKTKVEDSESYQKTVSSISDGGKIMSDSISSAGTKIKENETFKSVGEKTSSALKRTGTAFKDTSTAIKENETIKTMGYKISDAASTLKGKVWYTGDPTDDTVPNGKGPTKEETVIPDKP